MSERKKKPVDGSGPEKIGLHNLAPGKRSTRDRKRVGRGPGSGTGKTSGRGVKGSKARAGHHGPGGGKVRFEGGQMPLTRRLPKKGMTKKNRQENELVTLTALDRLPTDAEVTPESLVAAGLVRGRPGAAKLLATGAASRAFTVRGVRVSAGAREQIIAAGGRIEE